LKELPSIDPVTRNRLILMAFVGLAVFAGLIASWVNYKSPEQLAPVTAAITRAQPGVTDIATPREPAPTPARSWKEYLANNPPAPRAALVKLPPPKAQLVRLPELRVGEERQLIMPYGLEVSSRYKEGNTRRILANRWEEIGGIAFEALPPIRPSEPQRAREALRHTFFDAVQ
jgi:hypothetical protein